MEILISHQPCRVFNTNKGSPLLSFSSLELQFIPCHFLVPHYLDPAAVQDVHSLLSVNTHDGPAARPLRQLLGPPIIPQQIGSP